MPAPNPPPDVLEMFFGTAEQPPADVVLTPIPAFYWAVVERAADVREYRGWWKLAIVTGTHGRFGVVQHFEGSRVVDPVRALAGPVSRLAFLGLYGSLDPRVRVGQTVRVAAASRRGEPPEIPGPPCGASDGGAEWPVQVEAVTVDGLLDDAPPPVPDSFLPRVVDLESHFFFRSARGQRVRSALALGLVTDEPGIRPFWTLPMSDADLAPVGVELARLLDRWLSARPELDASAARRGGTP